MNRLAPARLAELIPGAPARCLLAILLIAMCAIPFGCRSRTRVAEPVDPLAGWSLFPYPRENYGPGTIVRVDANGIGHRVTSLPRSNVSNRDESITSPMRRSASFDRLARLIVGDDPSRRELATRQREDASVVTFDVELEPAVRYERIEPAKGETFESRLASLFNSREFSPYDGDAYYIVRETRSARAVRISIPEESVRRNGGRAALVRETGISDSAIFERTEDKSLHVDLRYDRPRQVLFRADRILFEEEGVELRAADDVTWIDVDRWPLCREITVTMHTTLDDREAENGVELALLDRGAIVENRVMPRTDWLPGDTHTTTFELEPPLRLTRIADLGVAVTYDIMPDLSPNQNNAPDLSTATWQASFEAVATLDDDSRMTLVRKTRSIEFGAGIATRWQTAFDVTQRPLYRNPRVPVFSSVEVTLRTTDDKPAENDVKVSLLLQGHTIASERADDEYWENGKERTFVFFIDRPVPYLGLDEMDMAIETQLIVDEAWAADRWRMSLEAVGVLRGGDRVPLLAPERPIKVGVGEPTIVLWPVR